MKNKIKMGKNLKKLKMKKKALPNLSSKANITYNKGVKYFEQGKYEEALSCYNQSLNMMKQTLPPNDSSIAETLNNIGLVYLNQGKYIFIEI